MASYPDLSDVKKILVAKLRHHGDVLLAAPVFSVLRQRFPEAKIEAYIYLATAPMLEGHFAIDGFVFYDQAIKKKGFFKKLLYELKLLWQMRQKKYDLVINLTEGDRGALVAMISQAGIRIGFDPEKSGMLGKKKCYTHLVRKCHQTRHAVERDLDVLRCLGIFPAVEDRILSFFIPESADARVKQLLIKGGVDKEFVLIHPVSRWLFKCLPEKTIAEVIRHLSSKGKKVVLTASEDPLELEMNNRIIDLAKDCFILDLGGKISLKELGALIALSKCLICVDSVPMHIASALKAPVIAVFGPTSERTWAPWQNPQARVIAEQMTCRPCYMPGCGGSRKSDCLEGLSFKKICYEIDKLFT